MFKQEWDVQITPPTIDGGRFTISTNLTGGHKDVQYAATDEQAQMMKLQILERLKKAADHLSFPSDGCDAG